MTLVSEQSAQQRGYITLLFRANVSISRIYSIATHPEWLGKGLAAGLLTAAEQAALDFGCLTMHLEIRKDNVASMRLFQHRGYTIFGEYKNYYDDGEDAFRLCKSLTQRLRPELARIQYYRQMLGFTCGPACLMMAMKALSPQLELSRTLELQLWREATTIFMMAGHGGCSPHGLALAAYRHGFPSAIYVNENGALFDQSVRDQEKRAVIQIVHQDFVQQVAQCRIPTYFKPAGSAELQKCLAVGGIPLVLISAYRLTRERVPHWVVITGCDEHFFYIHDPSTSTTRDGDDCINMAIARKDFERMARYGKRGTKAVVVIYPPGLHAVATATNSTLTVSKNHQSTHSHDC